jgi:hypothetical protein
MEKENTPPGDDFMVRCRKLGNPVPFSYCRIENRGSPCFKIIDCWYEDFMVEDFLRQELTADEWERIFDQPPRPKVLTLIELIEEAKKRKTEEP